MRVAVLSDIHGFDLALERVLDDIDATGPYDEIVVAGDLCEVGPRPDRVIELIRERGYQAIQGNTDANLVDGRYGYGAEEVHYARELIGQDGIDWLGSLQDQVRIAPPGGTSPQDDLLIVHANPHDQLRALDPSLSDRELLELLLPVEASAIAFGHIHICYTRESKACCLSMSRPSAIPRTAIFAASTAS